MKSSINQHTQTRKNPFAKKLGLLLLAITCSSLTFADEYYWVASADGTWSDPDNWADSPGGGQGYGVPSSGDSVYFDDNSLAKCTLDANIDIGLLEFMMGYTGEFIQGSYEITIGTGGLIITECAFTGGSGYILSEGGVNVGEQGTLTAPAQFTTHDDFINTGVFDHNFGVVIADVTYAPSLTMVLALGTDVSFWGLELKSDEITSTPQFSIGGDGYIGVMDELLLSGTGKFNVFGTFNIWGDLTQTNTNLLSGRGTANFVLVGDGSQTITGLSSEFKGVFPKITIDKPSGTASFSGYVNITRGIDLLNGAVDGYSIPSVVSFFSSNQPFYINGDMTLGDVTFVANQTANQFYLGSHSLVVLGELKFVGAQKLELMDGIIYAFGDFVLSNNGSNAGGDCTIYMAGSGTQKIKSTVATPKSTIPHLVIAKDGGVVYSSGQISIQGDLIKHSGNFLPGAEGSKWYFIGQSTEQVIDLKSAALSPFGEVHIQPSSGTVKLNSDIYVQNDLNIYSSKTLSLNGYNCHLKEDLILNGTISGNGSAVFFGDNQTISGTNQGRISSLTLASTGAFTLGADLEVTGTLSLESGQVNLNTYTITMSNTSSHALSVEGGEIDQANDGDLVLSLQNGTKAQTPFKGDFMKSGGYTYDRVTLSSSISEYQQIALFMTDTNHLRLGIDLLNLPGVAQVLKINFQTNAGFDLPVFLPVDASGNFGSAYYVDMHDGQQYPADYTSLGSGYVLFDGADSWGGEIWGHYAPDARNWEQVRRYDSDGTLVSNEKEYIDPFGRRDMFQKENIATGDVIALLKIYDEQGRVAINTLPAISGTTMTYNSLFVKNAGGNAYDYTDFDTPTTTYNPGAVGTGGGDNLGYYYSSSGPDHIDQTSYPYTRIVYSDDPQNAPVEYYGVSETFKAGSGRAVRSYTMTAVDELDPVLSNGKTYKVLLNGTDPMINPTALSITDNIELIKNVAIAPDGKEAITYKSIDGLTIATCRSGLSSGCSTTTVTSELRTNTTRTIDIHLPYANITSLKLPALTYNSGSAVSPLNYNYVIHDLKTKTTLVEGAGNDFTINVSTRFVTFNGFTGDSKVLRISINIDDAYEQTIYQNGYTFDDINVQYGLDYSHWELNYYDLMGRLRKAVSARDCSCNSSGSHTYYSVFDYDSDGHMVAEQTPDEGLAEYVYNSRGQFRFSQNAQQREEEKFSYTSYDDYYRVISTGEYTTVNNSYYFKNYYGNGTTAYTGCTAVSAILEDPDGLSASANVDDETEFAYHTALEDNTINGLSGTLQNTYAQTFLIGHVAETTKVGERKVYLSYDQFGRTSFEAIEVLDQADFGTFGSNDDYFRIIRYKREELLGYLEEKIYQDHVTNERVSHQFAYDANLAVASVNAYLGSGTSTHIGEVTYEYNPHFQMTRAEYGGDLQGMDYTYLAGGMLKALNHPSLTSADDPGGDGGGGSTFYTDLFGFALDYFADDYSSDDNSIISSFIVSNPGLYNGLIGAIRSKTNSNYAPNAQYIWKGSMGSSTQIISASTDEIRHAFTYDDFNRLANANFSIYHHTSATASSNTSTAYNDFKVFGAANSGTDIEYDRNGNILSLKRNGYALPAGGDLTMDYLAYTYNTGTNQLGSIIDNATISPSAYGTDFDASTSQSFSYDNSGRLIASAAENIDDILYYHSGLVHKIIYSSGESETYYYDQNNRKSRVEFYNGVNTETTWYITTTDGDVHAIFTNVSGENAAPAEYPIDGGRGRTGTYFVASEKTFYEMKDHLGNTRVVFGESGGALTVLSWADYYPFGAKMPGRSYSTSAYRYGQSARESTAITHWTNYPLRMFNNLLGRFTTPDPFRQEHNPYQGMGNNPVSNIDPTGGAYTGYTAFINSEVDALQRAYAVGYQWNEEMSRYKEALLFAPAGSGKVNFDGLEVNASAAMSMVRTNTDKDVTFTLSSGLRTFYLASDGHGNVVSTLTLQEAVKYSSYVHVTLGKSVQENAKTIEEAIVKAEAEGKEVYIEGIGELNQYSEAYMVSGEKRHLICYSLNGQYNANPSFGEGITNWYTKSSGLPIHDEMTSLWSQFQQAGVGVEDWIGPALIAVGARIKALKPKGILGSLPGSSIASSTLSKVLPLKMPFRVANTTNLGRMLGRILPFTGIGVAMTALSIEDVFREISPKFDTIIGMRDIKMGIGYSPRPSTKTK